MPKLGRFASGVWGHAVTENLNENVFIFWLGCPTCKTRVTLGHRIGGRIAQWLRHRTLVVPWVLGWTPSAGVKSLSKLLITHCVCPPSSNGYLLQREKNVVNGISHSLCMLHGCILPRGMRQCTYVRVSSRTRSWEVRWIVADIWTLCIDLWPFTFVYKKTHVLLSACTFYCTMSELFSQYAIHSEKTNVFYLESCKIVIKSW